MTEAISRILPTPGDQQPHDCQRVVGSRAFRAIIHRRSRSCQRPRYAPFMFRAPAIHSPRTAAQARRRYSAYCHRPLAPVCRVTTRSRLGTNAINWPPDPGLYRASGGDAVAAGSVFIVAHQPSGQFPTVREDLGVEAHHTSGDLTLCVDLPVCSTNHAGTIC